MVWTGDTQALDLGGYQAQVDERLGQWRRERFGERLWRKDPTLWFPGPVPEIADRLGWLELPFTPDEQVQVWKDFVQEVVGEGVKDVVTIGMGGSSLAPKMFQATFGNLRGYPKLTVLDSTHPAAVRAVVEGVDLDHALFVVSSKSGTTTETLDGFRYCWQQVSTITATPGTRFVAVTDPGTPLERLAQERHFRRVFPAPADVGGRYSALSVFGLLPAALIGVDVERLLGAARDMAEACGRNVREEQNPALALGAALGELALAGRDKVTFLTTPSLESFAYWIEQLIAESTGKEGRGMIPVVGETPRQPGAYGPDRFFAQLLHRPEHTSTLEVQTSALKATVPPVAITRIDEKEQLGGEFFRWEMAIAAAGAVIGIHPFDQPDVQLAKDLARKAMAERGGESEDEDMSVPVDDRQRLEREIRVWLSRPQPGDYVAVQAFLAPAAATTILLQRIRRLLRDRLLLATTAAYGPQFLHSTGQLHKGGPNTGLFLQLIDQPHDDLPVPETDYTFGALIRAQALGDYRALMQRGRRVLRVNLGADAAGGLGQLVEILRRFAPARGQMDTQAWRGSR